MEGRVEGCSMNGVDGMVVGSLCYYPPLRCFRIGRVVSKVFAILKIRVYTYCVLRYSACPCNNSFIAPSI